MPDSGEMAGAQKKLARGAYAYVMRMYVPARDEDIAKVLERHSVMRDEAGSGFFGTMDEQTTANTSERRSTRDWNYADAMLVSRGVRRLRGGRTGNRRCVIVSHLRSEKRRKEVRVFWHADCISYVLFMLRRPQVTHLGDMASHR